MTDRDKAERTLREIIATADCYGGVSQVVRIEDLRAVLDHDRDIRSGARVLYPEVEPFVDRMYAELWANRQKGDQAGWRAMSPRQAWGEIAWHNAKMATAIKAEDWELVQELAADVANGAMMLTDILNQRQSEVSGD